MSQAALAENSATVIPLPECTTGIQENIAPRAQELRKEAEAGTAAKLAKTRAIFKDGITNNQASIEDREYNRQAALQEVSDAHETHIASLDMERGLVKETFEQERQRHVEEVSRIDTSIADAKSRHAEALKKINAMADEDVANLEAQKKMFEQGLQEN